MNRIMEEEFVRSFIDERRRDALLLELCSEQTRRRAVERFARDAGELLDCRQTLCSDRELTAERVAELLGGAFDPADPCYLMFADWSDGVTLGFEEALAACLDSCGPASVLFGSSAALIKEAGDGQSSVKHLLRRREY